MLNKNDEIEDAEGYTRRIRQASQRASSSSQPIKLAVANQTVSQRGKGSNNNSSSASGFPSTFAPTPVLATGPTSLPTTVGWVQSSSTTQLHDMAILINGYGNSLTSARSRVTFESKDDGEGESANDIMQRSMLMRTYSNNNLDDQECSASSYRPVRGRQYGSTSSLDLIDLDKDTVDGSMKSSYTDAIKSKAATIGKRQLHRFNLRRSDHREHQNTKKKEPTLAFLKRFRSSSGKSSTNHSNDDGSRGGTLHVTHSSGNIAPDPISSSEREVSSTSNVSGYCTLPGGQRVSRHFVHYDCQSIGWQWRRCAVGTAAGSPSGLDTAADCRESGSGGVMCGLSLRETRSVRHHTGASAASMRVKSTGRTVSSSDSTDPAAKNHRLSSLLTTTPHTADDDEDDESDEAAERGDGASNSLVQCCPYFRNELGSSLLRLPALTRLTSSASGVYSATSCPCRRRATPSANAASILELEMGSGGQQLQQSNLLEFVDQGATYYRTHFHKLDHQNWFGMDDTYGPIAVSVRREKLTSQSEEGGTAPASGTVATEGVDDGGGHSGYLPTSPECAVSATGVLWRVIVRTKSLATLRGAILEDAICASSARFSATRGLPVKDVLQQVLPDLPLGCLRQGVSDTKTEETLIKLDEQGLSTTYKIGIMLCKAGQYSEEEMYNNENSSPAFEEFLNLLGEKVALQSFDGYKAGLDVRSDTTGTHSYYKVHLGKQIMFHVSTLLPFTPSNIQQLMRKRHIGNDIVTIVFQEPGALPFSPETVRSQFQHVFIVVRVHNPCTELTTYSVAISRSRDVPPFGPPLPARAVFSRSQEFAEFILTRAINAENAAHRSEKFLQMQQRTREDYLKDLAANHVTTTSLDTKGKFFLSSGRKKTRPRFDSKPWLRLARGAFFWQVDVVDASLAGAVVKCQLAIGWDTLVLVEEKFLTTIMALPNRAILGWTRQGDTELRVYYHESESFVLRLLVEEETNDIIQRLMSVTPGCETEEIMIELTRVGFCLSRDGQSLTVSAIEQRCTAALLGLRAGARVVRLGGRTLVEFASTSRSGHSEVHEMLRAASPVELSVLPPVVQESDRNRPALDPFVTNAALGYFQRSDVATTPTTPPEGTQHAGQSPAVRSRSRSGGSTWPTTGTSPCDPTPPPTSLAPAWPVPTHGLTSPLHRGVTGPAPTSGTATMTANGTEPGKIPPQQHHRQSSNELLSLSVAKATSGAMTPAVSSALANLNFRENLKRRMETPLVAGAPSSSTPVPGGFELKSLRSKTPPHVTSPMNCQQQQRDAQEKEDQPPPPPPRSFYPQSQQCRSPARSSNTNNRGAVDEAQTQSDWMQLVRQATVVTTTKKTPLQAAALEFGYTFATASAATPAQGLLNLPEIPPRNLTNTSSTAVPPAPLMPSPDRVPNRPAPPAPVHTSERRVDDSVSMRSHPTDLLDQLDRLRQDLHEILLTFLE